MSVVLEQRDRRIESTGILHDADQRRCRIQSLPGQLKGGVREVDAEVPTFEKWGSLGIAVEVNRDVATGIEVPAGENCLPAPNAMAVAGAALGTSIRGHDDGHSPCECHSNAQPSNRPPGICQPPRFVPPVAEDRPEGHVVLPVRADRLAVDW